MSEDLATLTSRLAQRLRSCGVEVDLRGAESFAVALTRLVSTPADTTRSRVYWTARITLLHEPGQILTFDRVFAEVFGPLPRRPEGTALPIPSGAVPYPVRPVSAGRADVPEIAVPWATRPRARAGGQADGECRAVPLAVPVASTRLDTAPAPFARLDPDELDRLAVRLAALTRAWPRRRTRRRRTGRRGAVDLRRTLARARRTGGEPLRLTRTRPYRRPRRIVVLCDVSESMQPYVAAYLHLLRAVTVGSDGETFAFATRLTRLTPLLAHGSPEEAIARADARVTDRYGGTRIATNLRALLGSRHGDLVRGAVVVIASDGWDTDPPAELGRQMARLARRTHRVVWLNPRAAVPGFRPLAGGMAVAMPWCDALLGPGTAEELVAALPAIVAGPVSSTGSRRPRAGSV